MLQEAYRRLHEAEEMARWLQSFGVQSNGEPPAVGQVMDAPAGVTHLPEAKPKPVAQLLGRT